MLGVAFNSDILNIIVILVAFTILAFVLIGSINATNSFGDWVSSKICLLRIIPYYVIITISKLRAALSTTISA